MLSEAMRRKERERQTELKRLRYELGEKKEDNVEKMLETKNSLKKAMNEWILEIKQKLDQTLFSPEFWKLCSLVCLEFVVGFDVDFVGFMLLKSGNFIVLNNWIIFG